MRFILMGRGLLLFSFPGLRCIYHDLGCIYEADEGRRDMITYEEIVRRNF